MEDNHKPSSSSNVDSSSNVETNNAKHEYKGVAENIHNRITKIDKELNELKPNSENYNKEKEALLDERESLTEHMTLLNQYKSTRAMDNNYIPQSSDNKRAGDSSLTDTSSSKRSRD